MKCYKCNSTLSENNFCNSCGADVVVYKKVLKLSNAYYNMGLAKAQIRDLTGACELLRRSVRLEKRNTNARNLLGLVYFEMGEAVQAFSEWVISKNYQPEKNLADEYIRRLQSNPGRLDTINQTIKKYNTALYYAKQDNSDVAVIQLKKVLNTNPNLIKGHLLLALLYMKKDEHERARKPLMKVLKIDCNNPLARKYLKEVESVTGIKKYPADKEIKKEVKQDREEKREKTHITGNDVIIPQRSSGYKESNSGIMSVVNVVIGLVIGVVIAYFLLIPAKESSVNAQHKKEILKLNTQMDTINGEKKELENQIALLQSEKESLNGQLSQKGTENEAVVADYSNMITAINYFNAKDYVNCAAHLNAISDINRTEQFASLFNVMKPEAYKQAAAQFYNSSKTKFYAADTVDSCQDAINDMEQCLKYDLTAIDYGSLTDMLGATYLKQYELALAADTTTAGQYKEKALSSLANVVNTILPSIPNVDNNAIEKVQAHIAAITDK